jgi:hypothetical protein
MKTARFGESVEGYAIPVLNEREIRASAGILFLLTFSSWTRIAFRRDYTPIKYAIAFFLMDFALRLFVNPRYSPALILGRFIVRNQAPEYVGAPQKRFAWSIGLFLSATMFVLMVVVNSYSVLSSLCCWMCMVFLFFESAFGICLGCLVYGRFYGDKALYCSGEACGTKMKTAIQKIAPAQVGIVIGAAAYIVLAAFLFGARLGEKPSELWTLVRNGLSR